MTRDYNPIDKRAHDAQRAEQERADRIKAEQYRDDMQWFANDARGRRLMWEWLAWSGLFRTSFTGNSETFFKEGTRNMGLKLQADMLNAAPESFAQMLLDRPQAEVQAAHKPT